MEHMTLELIAACCNGTYFGEETKKNIEVSNIAIDSRKIMPGGLFIPICGERVDGHDFIPNVIQAGALACLSEKPLENPPYPYILVKSTRTALQNIAAYYRKSLDIKVIGITGSVGKTSTKEMIAAVLSEKYNVHKTAGNFNNEIGLPLTIFGIQKEHEIAALEMGISDFGEMHRLAETANPDICVITNIGQCHLENLGSLDGVLKAKTEAFAHLRENGVAILNQDDEKLANITQVNGNPPIWYGKKQGDAYASEIESLGIEGIRIRLHLMEESQTVTIPIAGEHNIYNALAAACAGKACGMTLAEICRGIERVKTIGGRSNIIKRNGITIMDDCYNANPMSMRASLDVLSGASGRKIAILGDMGELGEKERALHAEIGAYAAKKQIDYLFCVGELSKEMVAAAAAVKGSGVYTAHFDTKEDLLAYLPMAIKNGDTLLVKASHFMQFSKIVEAFAE